MSTFDEADVSDRRPEEVVVLVEEGMAALSRESDRVRGVIRIKRKLRLRRLLGFLYIVQRQVLRLYLFLLALHVRRL